MCVIRYQPQGAGQGVREFDRGRMNKRERRRCQEDDMPRAMWSGSISFGLVNVPVKLYTAARNKDIRFNQLHKTDLSRVQMKRFCADEQTEIGYDEIVKGYETDSGYVVITDEELEALAPAVT